MSFQANYSEELARLRNTIKKPNILVAGKTGAGKSSLINLCFGENVAAAGVGKPVTKDTTRYERSDMPIVIYDSVGYEIGESGKDSFENQLKDILDKEKRPEKEHIHICWYCISSVGGRFTDFDKSIIETISSTNTKIIVCLTKADAVSDKDGEALKREIEKYNNNIPVCETSWNVSGNKFDLHDLIRLSIDGLPEALKYSFIAAQRVDINEKKSKANKMIMEHCAAAFTTSLIPIPLANIPLLITNQAALIVRITELFEMSDHLLKYSLLVEAALSALLPQIAKYTVSQIIKIIPVLGTTIGDALNASAATAITYAIGTAVSETCAYFQEKRVNSATQEKINVPLKSFEEVFMMMLKNQKAEG